MKVIIAGGREIDVDYAMRILDELKEQGVFEYVLEIVSGCAHGVDEAGKRWARLHKIAIKEFPANWEKHGKAAGPIRNAVMADYADHLVLIWDGKSKGSKNMKFCMEKLGKGITERIVE